MSNSPLVSHVNISPNKNSPRNHAIDTITIHCVVGQCTVERLGQGFARPTRKASSNYGVGYDGRIGMYVEEKDRSWCSSNSANDNRAITIEVASDSYHPYAVNDKAYNALIDLVTDICQRNNIKKLVWSTNKNERVNHLNGCNMTVHRDYANKACPGDYLYSRHGDIAAKVNARLGATGPSVTEVTATAAATITGLKAGDIIKLKPNAKYVSGKAVPSWVMQSTLYARQVKTTGQIVFSIKQTGPVTGTVDSTQILSFESMTQTKTEPAEAASGNEFQVVVTSNALNIRQGPGTNNPVVGCIRNHGTYTIVETQGLWGRLKSGAGWIDLHFTRKIS